MGFAGGGVLAVVAVFRGFSNGHRQDLDGCSSRGPGSEKVLVYWLHAAARRDRVQRDISFVSFRNASGRKWKDREVRWLEDIHANRGKCCGCLQYEVSLHS